MPSVFLKQKIIERLPRCVLWSVVQLHGERAWQTVTHHAKPNSMLVFEVIFLNPVLNITSAIRWGWFKNIQEQFLSVPHKSNVYTPN